MDGHPDQLEQKEPAVRVTGGAPARNGDHETAVAVDAVSHPLAGSQEATIDHPGPQLVSRR
eukprot:3111759-Alexandrium_andersonii.AAC.1